MLDIFKAKKEALDKYASLNKNATAWRIVALSLSVVVLVLGISLVTVATRQQIIPWVVQVDQHGYAINIGPATQANSQDPRLVIAYLSRFIQGLRTVVTDPKAQRWLIESLVYSVIPDNSNALNTTNAYYRSNDPFERAQTKKETVSVEIRSILPVGDKSWRAGWQENVFKDGVKQRTENWTGLFETGVTPITDVKKLQDNPLGIYITEYSTTKNYN